MERKGWLIILMLSFLVVGCSSTGRYVKNAYVEEAKHFRQDFLKVNVAPALVGHPEFIAIEKGWQVASLAIAPVNRPINQYVLRPLVFQPIDRYFFQPFLAKPANWIVKKIVPAKKEAIVEEIRPIDIFSQIRLCFWDSSMVPAKTDSHQLIIHTVEKGESLWSIAQKYYGDGCFYKEIAQVNELENPDLIWPGQQLFFSVGPRQRHWTKVGGDPYQGSWQLALDELFVLPDQVKAQVRENIETDQFKWFTLKSGQHLNQITFGQNKVWSDVLCAWPKEELYAAKDYGVGPYRVIKVLKCNNWGWFYEGITEIHEPDLLKPSLEVRAMTQDDQSNWHLDLSHWELTSGAFKERFTDDTEVYGFWSVLQWYPLFYQDQAGRKHQFGIAAENINWRGDSGDGFHFHGGKALMIGPAYKLNTKSSETFIRLLYGQQKDLGFIHLDGSTPFGRDKYRMKQRTDIVSFYGSHERWNNQRKWFRKFRAYSRIDLDVGHKKKAWWKSYNDNSDLTYDRIDAKPENKDVYNLGFWLDIYEYKNGLIRPQLGFEIKHHAEGHKTGLRPMAGVSFLQDVFFFGYNYTFWNKHYADSWGLEAWIDFYKLYKFLKEGRWRQEGPSISTSSEVNNYEDL